MQFGILWYYYVLLADFNLEMFSSYYVCVFTARPVWEEDTDKETAQRTQEQNEESTRYKEVQGWSRS